MILKDRDSVPWSYSDRLMCHKRGLVLTFKLIKKSRCSLTDSLSKSTLCCGHSPRLSLMASMSVIILFPLMCAVPEDAGNKPVSIDIVVVFPAPLCPNRAVIWPLKIFSESSSTATLDPVELWKKSAYKKKTLLESTAQQLSFEWSHPRTSSKNWNVTTTF